ncbi:MAG: hypothetical protein M4D80_21265 [Myxococcota bacterium]|nr:hypothetical protein [Myxococcota bacterium]
MHSIAAQIRATASSFDVDDMPASPDNASPCAPPLPPCSATLAAAPPLSRCGAALAAAPPLSGSGAALAATPPLPPSHGSATLAATPPLSGSGAALAQGAPFAAVNLGAYVSRCAPLTSRTALDPPTRTTSASREITYPLLADWHAHAAAVSAGATDHAPSRAAIPAKRKRRADAVAADGSAAASASEPLTKRAHASRSKRARR